LLEMAIRYADFGFPAYDYLIENIKKSAPRLRKYDQPSSPFMPEGRLPTVGDLIRQPALAQTLVRISRNGPRELYRLETAERLVACIGKQGGLVSKADLGQHTTLWQQPLLCDFHGHNIATAPPNSWGLALLLMLNEVEKTDPALFNGALSARL